MNSKPFDSFKDYMLYLYVHVAYADGIVQDQEQVLIKYKIAGLFEGEDVDEKFMDAIECYKADSGNHEQVITDGHNQFADIQFYKKYKVFRDLYNIIGADGVVEESETEAMSKLKKIIGLQIDQMGI